MLDSLGEVRGVTPFSVAALAKNYYRDANYARLSPKGFQRMPDAVYASLVTNEVLNSEKLSIPKEQLGSNGALDGYIIGVGSGAIWSMMEYFNIPQNTKGDLRGIISIDRDPAALLTGMIIDDYAKSNTDIKTVLGDFFHQNNKKQPEENDPVIVRAKKIIELQGTANPEFAQILVESLPNLKSDLDRFTRKIVNLDGMMDAYDNRQRLLKGSYTVDLAEILFRNWQKIIELSSENKIAFIHADLKNAEAMDYISSQLPDIKSSSNLVYLSNVLDHLRRSGVSQPERNFLELEKAFDPEHRSHYVYARGYNIDIKDSAPDWQDV